MKYLLANRIFMLPITSFLILLYRYCEKAALFSCYVIAAFTWQVASGIPYWPHVRAIPSGSSTLASNSWTSRLKLFKVNFWLLLWPCQSPTFLFWSIHSFVILKLTLLHVLTLVRIVCICHVIPRGPSCRSGGASYNTKVKTLHEKF